MSKIKVKILGQLSYQTFPITEDMIDIDEDVLNQIGKTKQFKNGQVVDYISNTDIILQISQLKQKLADTDYKAIKFAEGELSIEEYEETKQQRRKWREEINKLELIINNQKDSL